MVLITRNKNKNKKIYFWFNLKKTVEFFFFFARRIRMNKKLFFKLWKSANQSHCARLS